MSARIEHYRTHTLPEPWLLVLFYGLESSRGPGFGRLAIARAVVDDFGNLVIVRGWQ